MPVDPLFPFNSAFSFNSSLLLAPSNYLRRRGGQYYLVYSILGDSAIFTSVKCSSDHVQLVDHVSLHSKFQ